LESEFDQIVDCVTTNKTNFFREPEHFEILVKRLVPSLLSQGRDRARRGIKLWSAAASSGAEAYTLAMVMTELQATLPCEFSILGTDISTEILQDARRAVYPISMLEGISAHFQKLFTM
jgi:chemotaxis protein methyltransferase CheR